MAPMTRAAPEPVSLAVRFTRDITQAHAFPSHGLTSLNISWVWEPLDTWTAILAEAVSAVFHDRLHFLSSCKK